MLLNYIFTEGPSPPDPPLAPSLSLPAEIRKAGQYLVDPGDITIGAQSQSNLHITSFLFRVLHTAKDLQAYYWLVGKWWSYKKWMELAKGIIMHN